MHDGEEEGFSPQVRGVQASRGDEPDAARRGDAGAVQEEEAAGDLPLRLVALPGARLGRAEPGAGAGRGDPGSSSAERLAEISRRARRPGARAGPPRPSVRSRVAVRRADRPAQGHVAAVPQLGRQGRAALVRRADAAALRPRAALDQGHRRDAAAATSATSRRSTTVRPLRRSAALDHRPGRCGPTSTRTTGSTA